MKTNKELIEKLAELEEEHFMGTGVNIDNCYKIECSDKKRKRKLKKAIKLCEGMGYETRCKNKQN